MTYTSDANLDHFGYHTICLFFFIIKIFSLPFYTTLWMWVTKSGPHSRRMRHRNKIPLLGWDNFCLCLWLESSCKGSFYFSPIYSFIWSFHVCLFYTLDFNLVWFYSFCCSNCSSLDLWEHIQLGSVSLWNYIILFYLFIYDSPTPYYMI